MYIYIYIHYIYIYIYIYILQALEEAGVLQGAVVPDVLDPYIYIYICISICI